MFVLYIGSFLYNCEIHRTIIYNTCKNVVSMTSFDCLIQSNVVVPFGDNLLWGGAKMEIVIVIVKLYK